MTRVIVEHKVPLEICSVLEVSWIEGALWSACSTSVLCWPPRISHERYHLLASLLAWHIYFVGWASVLADAVDQEIFVFYYALLPDSSQDGVVFSYTIYAMHPQGVWFMYSADGQRVSYGT